MPKINAWSLRYKFLRDGNLPGLARGLATPMLAALSLGCECGQFRTAKLRGAKRLG